MVASLPGGGVSDTPRSAAARNCASNSERATCASPGANHAFARELGADAVDQVAGGDGHLLAGFVVAARPRPAPSAAGMLLTSRQASSPRPCNDRGLDAQQALLE